MIVDSQKIDLLRRFLGTPDVDRRCLNAQFWCPLCDDRDVRKRKLAVRLSDGAAHCWVCGWKTRNVAILASRLGRRELLTEFEIVFGSPRSPVENTTVQPVGLPDDFRLLGPMIESHVDDPEHRACLRYLDSRRVNVDAIWSSRLGVSDRGMYRRRILFPSFDRRGHLNYLTARAVDPTVRPRYFNLEADRLSLIFNELDVDWTRELIVVEGPFDLLACVGNNVTCSLGSWLDENYALFEMLAIHRTPTLLFYDADAVSKQSRVARKLMSYDVPVRMVDWSGYAPDADPCLLGRDERKELISKAKRLDEVELMRRLITRPLDRVGLVS